MATNSPNVKSVVRYSVMCRSVWPHTEKRLTKNGKAQYTPQKSHSVIARTTTVIHFSNSNIR